MLLVLLNCLVRADPPPDRVQLKILTDPPGAQVIPIRNGSLRPDQRVSVGFTNGPPLIIPVPHQQSSVTLRLEHPLCQPRQVTIELQPYRANLADTYPEGAPLPLEYRSWAHALVGHVRPWLAVLLAVVLLALAVYVRHWRAATLMRRQADLDTSRAAEILDRVVPTAGDAMIGALLDGYRLTERLGQGGMARVYRGDPDEGGEPVAIKILDAELAADEQFVRRFNREKNVYADLSHPNIVRVLGCGSFREHYYLMMELVRGTTLRSRIREGGLPPLKVLELVRPVFRAVAYAHGRGIVHRDLKPENIMVSPQGKVTVMDFGMAGGQGYSAVTQTGSLLGTPAYMAPEQARGQLDPSSDQYALGIMVFEMLSGAPPFMDDNPVNIVFKHLCEEAPPLAQLRPELARVSPVVARMLAKEPGDRFPDLEQALTALERTL